MWGDVLTAANKPELRMAKKSDKDKRKAARFKQLTEANKTRVNAAAEGENQAAAQVCLVTAARQECLCMPRERN